MAKEKAREIAPPFYMKWTGEGFAPITPYVARMMDQHFIIGEDYRMVENPERSRKSHNEFFMTLKAMWETLPEHLEGEFPSPEHWRKYLLCRCGYCDIKSTVAPSNAKALELAALIKVTSDNPYLIVTVSGKVVTVYIPWSQAFDSMTGKTFQECKTKIYDMAAKVLASSPNAPKRAKRV